MADKDEPTEARERAWNRRRPVSALELALYAALVAAVLAIGSWSADPLRDAGCPGVVDFEFAVPGGGERSLPALAELTSECDGDAAAALRSAAERDFWFIAGYVVVLGWAGRRLGGHTPRLVGPLLWLSGRVRARAQRLRLIAPAKAHRAETWAARLQRTGGLVRRLGSPISRAGDRLTKKAGTGHGLLRGLRRSVGHGLAVIGAWLHDPELAAIDRGHVSRQLGAVGLVFAVLAGALDAVENAGLIHTADNLTEPSDRVLWATAGTAGAKWILAIAAILIALLYVVRLLLSALRSAFSGVTWRPDVVRAAAGNRWACPAPPIGGGEGWTLVDGGGPHEGEKQRLGICLSGGGIRSATFGLGALQELESAPDGWNLRDARYLSAVSGGSYIAASYQLLAWGAGDGQEERNHNDMVEAPGPRRRAVNTALRVLRHVPVVSGWAERSLVTRLEFVDEPPVASTRGGSGPLLTPGGPVERHIRHHAFHLADGAAEWVRAAGEVLLKAGSALVLILAAVWTVGLPLGWVYRDLVHGLDGDEPALWLSAHLAIAIIAPLVLFAALRAAVSAAEVVVSPLSTRSVLDIYRDKGRLAMVVGVGLVTSLLLVVPAVALGAQGAADWVGERLGVGDDDRGDPRPEANAAVAVIVEGVSDSAGAAGDAIDGAGPFLTTAARSGAVDAALDAVRLAAGRSELVLAELSSLDPDVDIDELVPLTSAVDVTTCHGPGAVNAPDETNLVVLGCEAIRAVDRTTRSLVDVVELVEAAGPAGPSGDEVAAHASALGAAIAAAGDAAAASGTTSDGVLALREAVASLEIPDASEPPPVRWAALSALITVALAWVAKRRLDVGARLGSSKSVDEARTRTTPGIAQKLGFGSAIEILAAALALVLALVVMADVIRDAWTRGPTGQLDLVVAVDAVWTWAITAGTVALATWRLNANTWSLRPFYHRRLWKPYAVTSTGETADWDRDTRLSIVGRQQPGRPELLVVAAVQVSGRDHAPPGRRALPFVFSARACGGPEVGYLDTRTLEALLGARHRHAVTLFGAVATSGAAFGPAMGRHSKGGLGSVLALVNARLGAWIPNPRRLAKLLSLLGSDEPRAGTFRRWPDLSYWIREIVGQYSLDDRMILATDGGHYENLGLVELLRRRCTRILCFDASGAGATPTTLAEAIILAREELGVTVELDVPAPSAADRQVDPSGADPFRRRIAVDDAKHLAERLAANDVVKARVLYPSVGDEPETEGVLVYGTLALADDPTDWDVLEYAQRHPEFPNDGTDRQWFRAEVFAAYHQLGRSTARRMLRAVEQ